jgi:PAP2 superfamily
MNARAIAMVQTAVFDAWACYSEVAVGTRLGGTLRRPLGEQTQGNKEQAISFAAYRTLLDLYPSRKSRFDSLMGVLGYDPTNQSSDTTTAVGIGNRCAQEILNFRHSDGANQLNNYADTTGYVPVNGPDSVVDPKYWQKIRFPNGATPDYIGPHWGNVTPFALTSSAQFRPPGPPEYRSTLYNAELNEVIQLTSNLTSAQRALVEYWADGPRSVQPPGHWLLMALNVSERDSHDLDRDVKCFFVLGNAVMDAGISCWEAKRYYNTSRPITVIRATVPGGATWAPAQSADFLTPPFPEYTSGHSTFSAAGAEVLKRFTGSDVFLYTPKTRVAPLTPSWSTFSETADQAGLSRRYGGIHFESADLEGRRAGRLVGALVWDKAQSYIEGIGTR